MAAQENLMHATATHGETGVLSALRLTRTPRFARVFARLTVVALAVGVGLLLVAPWQQNVAGSGRVVALDPLERPQMIEATIDGQVVEWFVKEGSHIPRGAPLVKIQDNDPELMNRLRASVAAAEDKVKSARDKIGVYHDQIALYTTARDLQIAIAQNQLEIAFQKLRGDRENVAATEAAMLFAEQVYERKLALFEKKLVSQQDVESETQKLAKARTDEAKARADVVASEREVQVKRDYINYARADAEAKIREASAKLREAEGEVAASQESLLKAERDLARFETQVIVAPRAGKVVRLLASQGDKGRQVKSGDALLEFVPDGTSRAVEIWVSGNDAPWVSPGRNVRLQFEGWPAVQFTAGWPSAALGTFGGEVLLVDATDDGSGNFRVLVVPSKDPHEPPWPGGEAHPDDVRRELRQGVRANGWILLNQVSLGYELWRQLNGFPPATTPDYTIKKNGGKLFDKKSK